jgi:hypothetical protein
MNDVTASALVPLVKTVTVAVDPARAFELFTEHMTHWWPLHTHSVGRERSAAVIMPTRVGEHIVETTADGQQHTWGTLTRWKPPREVAFTWHPGQVESDATRVSVRFREAAGGTEVELTHEGWAVRADGAAARDSYDSGWERVLACFTGLVSSQEEPAAE